MNGFKRLGFMPGQNALIYGAGPIGLLFAKLLKASGASCVMLCETAPARLDFARKFSGADRVADTSSEDARQVILYAAGRGCADIIVDTTGVMFEAAIAHAAAEGKILLFGINDRAKQNVRQYDITRKELQVIGSYATHLTFPNVIKLLTNNVLDLKPLLTHRVTLDDLPDGIETLRRGDAMKVVVYP